MARNKPEIVIGDSLATLANCQGYYDCPFNDNDEPLGRLVGYAGKYEPGKHFVGFVYANYAKAERHPFIMQHFASEICAKISGHLPMIDVFWGMPMGGISFALMLALRYQKEFGFPEKEIKKLKIKKRREQSALTLNRHEIEPEDKVAIVEDVTNNFSTTDKAIQLIAEQGGVPTAVICLLNRSLEVDYTYQSEYDIVLPVVSLARKKIPQYRQDDPRVAAEVKRGNVIWKPKDEWDQLTGGISTDGM